MSDNELFASVNIARSLSPDGLREMTVLSPALGRRADLTIYEPPGQSDDQPMPIVILLHGVYGSHWDWARNGDAHYVLADLVSSGRVGRMILAMPSDGLFGIGSAYVARAGEDSERWIVDEVPAAVKLACPRADITDVSIVGLSMGGWGALRLAGRYPRRLRAAAGMSPLTDINAVADYAPEPLKPAHIPNVDAPRLADLLKREHSELPPLRITCGTDDALIDAVRALHRELADSEVPHEYEESPGGHTWEYWANDLRASLLFIDDAGKALRP